MRVLAVVPLDCFLVMTPTGTIFGVVLAVFPSRGVALAQTQAGWVGTLPVPLLVGLRGVLDTFCR